MISVLSSRTEPTFRSMANCRARPDWRLSSSTVRSWRTKYSMMSPARHADRLNRLSALARAARSPGYWESQDSQCKSRRRLACSTITGIEHRRRRVEFGINSPWQIIELPSRGLEQ